MSALIEAARAALEAWDSLPRKTYSLSTSVSEWLEYRMAPTIARLRAALAAAERPYTDSTPHLNVGNSSFEHWFQAQPFATQPGIKQVSRDSYAAGMGDPLVVAAAEQPAEPVAWCCLTPSGKIAYFDGKPMVMPGPVGNDCHTTPLYASPAAPAQAPLPHLKAAADAVMAHQWSNSREAMQALTELIEAALAHGIGSKP